ncbi:hypothetical protein ACP4OV_014997 [Aristida adscensionis]
MARLLLACLLLLSLAMAAPTMAAAQVCGVEMVDLIVQCQDYVRPPAEPKVEPSAACCDVIERADIPCLCNMITPVVEKSISMEKAVFVAGFCGSPLQPGSNCGSAIVFLVRSLNALIKIAIHVRKY